MISVVDNSIQTHWRIFDWPLTGKWLSLQCKFVITEEVNYHSTLSTSSFHHHVPPHHTPVNTHILMKTTHIAEVL